MDAPQLDADPPAPAGRPKRARRAATLAAAAVLAYAIVAYVLMPIGWKRFVRRHPYLADVPGITHTASGIPGDPLNVALIGGELEVKRILLAANWLPADELTLHSCLGIATATVLRRPYGDAPVSNLYLWGRKQDLAFELPVGRDPRQRHHVRWWRSERTGPDGRPLWLGAATYDKGVGFSHATGQITHHIAADVDAERDFLFETLQQTGQLSESCLVSGFHEARQGRNGGGDSWYTDGDLLLGVIRAQEPASAPPPSSKDEGRGA